MHDTLLPVVYSVLYLRTNRHCRQVLPLLQRSPYLAGCVKVLMVEPPVDEGASAGHSVSAQEPFDVASLMKLVVNLPNLRTFSWYGRGMPGRDDLWLKLRTS